MTSSGFFMRGRLVPETWKQRSLPRLECYQTTRCHITDDSNFEINTADFHLVLMKLKEPYFRGSRFRKIVPEFR
jgi:hypothetical protein